jgi:hypothetical protein
MGLSRGRAKAALQNCAELSGLHRGALLRFLSSLSDDDLGAMGIEDQESDDVIAGFLQDEKSGDI